MTYLYSFIIGGLMVSTVTYLARNGLPAASGIVMTLPVITIVSLVLLPAEASYKVAAFGVIGVLALLVFLATFIAGGLILGFGNKYASIFIAFIAWCIVVLALIKLFPQVFKT